MKEFCLKIEMPLRVLIDEAISLPPDEAGAFMSGLSHAFRRTFDISGWPMGWNTNSPILIGICLGWRMIVTQSPSLPFIHKELVKVLGENAVGSEDRVKKICHRAGLRFSGSRTGDSQGTTEILDVPSVSEEQSR